MKNGLETLDGTGLASLVVWKLRGNVYVLRVEPDLGGSPLPVVMGEVVKIPIARAILGCFTPSSPIRGKPEIEF